MKMISLHDLFNAEIGNDFIFTDQSLSAIPMTGQSCYIPSTDLVTMKPPHNEHVYNICHNAITSGRESQQLSSLDEEDRDAD
ncbi:unnamed protein product, partial [Medioppia subpectinata]